MKSGLEEQAHLAQEARLLLLLVLDVLGGANQPKLLGLRLLVLEAGGNLVNLSGKVTKILLQVDKRLRDRVDESHLLLIIAQDLVKGVVVCTLSPLKGRPRIVLSPYIL